MLLYNIEALAKKLATEYATTTDKLEHMGLRGTAREDLLKDIEPPSKELMDRLLRVVEAVGLRGQIGG